MSNKIELVCRNKILNYIKRLSNSGLGKKKSLEYLTKYISSLVYLTVERNELERSELWKQNHPTV